jgi:hypothetical protein
MRTLSYIILLALMGCLVLIKFALACGNFPDDLFASPSQKALFSWPAIGIVTAVGLLGVWFAQLAGFPEMWDPRVSTKQRFLLPALIGLGFGMLEVTVDRQTHMTRLVLERTPELQFFHIKFPASALVYPGGAILVDTITHLAPIPLLMLVIYALTWPVRGRFLPNDPATDRSHGDWAFWISAGLLSLFEPVTQSGILGLLPGASFRFHNMEGFVAYWMLSGYALNLTQAYLFRRFGFLACLTMRISMYLLWHVCWGYLTQSGQMA